MVQSRFAVRFKEVAWEKVILSPKSKHFSSYILLSCGKVVCMVSINVDSRFSLDCYRVYDVAFL